MPRSYTKLHGQLDCLIEFHQLSGSQQLWKCNFINERRRGLDLETGNDHKRDGISRASSYDRIFTASSSHLGTFSSMFLRKYDREFDTLDNDGFFIRFNRLISCRKPRMQHCMPCFFNVFTRISSMVYIDILYMACTRKTMHFFQYIDEWQPSGPGFLCKRSCAMSLDGIIWDIIREVLDLKRCVFKNL